MKRPVLFIGMGNMGRSILNGLISTGTYTRDNILVLKQSADEELAKHVQLYTNINDIPPDTSRTVMLCVKPQVFMQHSADFRRPVSEKDLIISVMAGVPTELICQTLGIPKQAVIRAMPNTPCLIGKGYTALYSHAACPASDKELAEQMFSQISICGWVKEEDFINRATAVSGSGPAYFFLLAEYMIKAAQDLGFDADTAAEMVSRTFSGAAELLVYSREKPEQLRRRVTSKGGTTEAAISQFINRDLEKTVTNAVNSAYQRALSLSQSNH